MKKFTLILILLFNILNVSYSQNNLNWHSISPFIPKSISYDPYRNNLIWLTGTGGLFRYDINTNQWKSYTNAEGLSKIWASSLYVEENTILVGTESGGANIFNIQSERFIPFLQYTNEGPSKKYSPSILSIYSEHDRIWLGTMDDGIYLVDKITLNTIKHFTKDDGLGENCVYSIIDDGQSIWLSTAYCGACLDLCPITGGITSINKSSYEFRNFTLDSTRDVNYFYSLALTGDTLWAAGEKGLFMLNKESGSFTPVFENQILSATSITVDQGYIWCIGKLSGNSSLIKIDISTHKILNSLPIPVYSITLLPGSDYLYLISSSNYKMNLYKMNKSSFELELIPNDFIPNSYCYGLSGDENNIFAGSGKNIISINNSNFNYSALDMPNKKVRDITLDEEFLWVSTDSGLWKYKNTQSFELQENFLISEIVYNAIPKDDYIWVNAQMGLYRINKADGQIIKKDLSGELNIFGTLKISDVLFEGDYVWLCFTGSESEGGLVSGIIKINSQTLSTVQLKIFPKSNYSLQINNLIDAGEYFLTSGKEIYKINKSDLSIESFIDQHADRILLKDNLLWVIIHLDGIKIFDLFTGEEKFYLNESNGLLHNIVTDLFVNSSNAYFTTYGGISILDLSFMNNVLDAEGSTLSSSKFILHDNYPNPFNPVTKIKYSIPSNVKGERSNVKISVYDILGNEIAALVNKEQQPGEYEVEFVAGKYSSGIYFYVLSDGKNVISKKMVLLK